MSDDLHHAAAEIERLRAAETEMLGALDALVSACELPGDHCEVEQALPAAITVIAKVRLDELLAGTETYNERKTMYPNDEQFEETTVAKARDDGNGWSIERADGWSFYVPAPSPVVPKEGMVARFYGKGIGFTVRGLFLDGQRVFYRTEAEDKEKHEIDTYGADAADWLKRWDEGGSVWSIEMGGLGPGYEQCIHITAAEILRHLLERKYEPATWYDKDAWERDRKEIEAAGFANTRIIALGLSAAQWCAALNLALQFYRLGPRAVMTDERVKDRHIQVQRTFPVAA